MDNLNEDCISEKNLLEFINDNDFIELNRHLSAFNPFSVLKLEGHEIRHSNILAWLFDPDGSHGLGKTFLEQFLLCLPDATYEEFNKENERIALKIASDFSLTSEWSVFVRREAYLKGKKRIDLEITCENNIDNKRNFVILIENKVYSTQGKNQLKDYREDFEEKIKTEKLHFKMLPVYLTLNEDDTPNDTNYFHFTYKTIHEILEKILNTHGFAKQNEDAERFIRFYKSILEERLNMDTKEVKLAEEIYKKYYKEIDFIMAHASFDASDIALAGNEFIEEFNAKENNSYKLEKLNSTSRAYFFTDSILKNTTGGKKTDWRNCAVCGYFFEIWKFLASDRKENENEAKLYFHIEVGPFNDAEKRKKLLKVLEKNGFDFKKPKNEDGGIYTRITLKAEKIEKVKKINDISNTDDIKQKMLDLFEKSKDMIDELHKTISEFKELVKEHNQYALS